MRIRVVLIRRHRAALTLAALLLATLGVAAACTLTRNGAERETALAPGDREMLPSRLRAGPFTVHHDLPAAEADAYATLLDRSRANFHRVMTTAGFDLRPPAAPLPWLVFADENGYLAHQGRTPGRDVAHPSGGYYSSRRNQVVVFHGGGHHVPRTLHEAAHQLAFNTGVQNRDVAYPFWFAEGLATNFEAGDTDVSWGPHTANPRRAAAIRWALRRDRLIPLAEFVAVSQLDGNAPHQRTLGYAQAWSLFRFLFHERPAALRRYAAAMYAGPPGRPTPEEHRAHFTHAFGDLAPLEAAYRRYLAEH